MVWIDGIKSRDRNWGGCRDYGRGLRLEELERIRA